MSTDKNDVNIEGKNCKETSRFKRKLENCDGIVERKYSFLLQKGPVLKKENKELGLPLPPPLRILSIRDTTTPIVHHYPVDLAEGTKECVYCKIKSNISKLVDSQCGACNVALCYKPCHARYHVAKNIY
uniref:Tnp_zf-ribbon_2 domain-containing protein n=1 Tax=Rhabditophanes sp. KR3021 TaxID=114890 RepID=A0AC35TTK4_9BILA